MQYGILAWILEQNVKGKNGEIQIKFQVNSNIPMFFILTNMAWGLYSFARAVVTKNHKLNGFNNRELLSHGLEAMRPR